jgi:hypothetical protein
MRTSMMLPYKPFLSEWKAEYGKKPTTQEISNAETVARSGSKTAFALALGLRPEGTSQSTIVKVLGLPHRNKIKKLEGEKKLKVKRSKTRPSMLQLELRH